MPSSADRVAAELAAWGDVPHVVTEVFPDASAAGIAAAIEAFCEDVLGARSRPPSSSGRASAACMACA